MANTSTKPTVVKSPKSIKPIPVKGNVFKPSTIVKKIK